MLALGIDSRTKSRNLLNSSPRGFFFKVFC